MGRLLWFTAVSLSFTFACGNNRRTVDDSGALTDAMPRDAEQVDVGTDTARDSGTDTGARDTGTDTGARDTGRFDAARPDTGTDAGTDVGAPDTGTDTGVDAGSSPVGRGVYRYSRLPIGGLEAAHVVKFHPDGSYAVVVEQSNVIHLYDWATETTSRYDLDPPGGASIRWEDFAFDASGTFGILVGTLVDGAARTGIIYHLDDAAVRADMDPFTEQLDARRAGADFVAVEYPWDAGLPMVLSRNGGFPWNAAIRRYDPTAGDFGAFITATATSAGCDDLAFVNNEFGGEGVALVCGSGGADAPYWTEIGGVGEWRSGPAATLGNTSRADAYPGGSYALGIGWSGRRVHRFDDGAWRPTSTAPWFTTRGVWDVEFQQGGQRALIVGRALGSPLIATVLEYRHDLWSMPDITDVSIAGFSAAPYNADSNFFLFDSAFRPGCDGGLIVGGKTNFAGSVGLAIEFQIEGGRDCSIVIE